MRVFKTDSKLIILLVFALILSVQAKWSSEWVYYNAQGKLEYKADDKGNIIPDFSKVGYRQGKIPPNIKVVKTLTPISGDNLQKIQTAIDEVGKMPLNANGFRGSILLKKGTYAISDGLKINRSGVVLRGEGDSDNGTILIFTAKSQIKAITISRGSNLKEIVGTRVKIADTYVPVGTKEITLESAAKYSVGDEIMLYRPGTDNWIHDLKMDQIPQNASGTIKQWTAEGYNTQFERKIEKISGNTIIIDQPVVMAMEDKYGGGYVYKYTETKRVSNCGIENILLKSTFDSTITKNKDGKPYYADEDHAWTAVYVRDAKHSWVRNITSKHFGFASVSVKGKFISVLNCKDIEPVSIITSGRRYTFSLDGQMGLVSNCETDKGRHSFVSGVRTAGPNVFTRSKATNTYGPTGPHHRWVMGFLYDVIETTGDGRLDVQNRLNSGSGHGWAGVNHVLWNCTAKSYEVQSPWVTGRNYVIGCRGKKLVGHYDPTAPDGIWDGHGETDLEIESLYEAQVKDNDITTPIVAPDGKMIVKKNTSSITLVNKNLVLNYSNLKQNAKVKIFAPTGRMVKTVVLNGAKEVSLKNLNHGLYLVKFMAYGVSETKKLLLK